MRFGIKTAPQHTTWPAMLDVWRAADDIDVFESAWNFDHFYPIFSDSDGPCLEAWTMLAAMAQATRRVRIGCQVTGMIYRHPAVLANMAATVDIISGGRLDVGVGAGWNQQECDAYGITLPPLKERFDRFDEGVEALVLLLSQETSNLDGKYVQLRDARCEPKPVQRPHPPITIGGNGPTRTLRTVARFAQQWNSTSGIEHWPASKETLEKRCAEIGRDPATIEYSVNLRYDASAGTSAIADSAAAFAEAGADIGIVYLPVPHTPTVLEPIADALRSLAT
ncbi:MAG TPA: TIGR03560 family F420-dependent LLM class oxidoreductase [Acidimicrobiia bacterium]|nr:TIGR03560 family F420-dependent LLM class oxidoreductase [Acidimicrobiia bacterium]